MQARAAEVGEENYVSGGGSLIGFGGPVGGAQGERRESETGKGCHLCLMITKSTNRASQCQYAVRPYYLPPVMDPRHDERYVDVPLVFGRVGKKVNGHGRGTDDYWEWTMVCLSNEELFAAEMVLVPGGWRPRFSSPMGYNEQNPETNIMLLKDWLDHCRRNHTKCREIKKTTETTGTDFLPTRLIDVQAFGAASSSFLGNDVRLVSLNPTTTHSESDTNTNFPPPYLTLSHCWGPPEKRPTTTIKSNLAQRMEGISFWELPRTFRDAIEVTRKLGHRYLWIDSLCIVQDDEQDWAHEAGLMAKVYSHSTCTLSALSSEDSSKGLCLESLDEDRSFMDLSINYSQAHPIHYSATGGNKSGMNDPSSFNFPRFRIFYSLNDWNTLYHGKIQIGLCDDISPLRSRAWTLQERELSRRIIHFAKHQVLWECAELKATAQRPWHHSAYPVLNPELECWGEEWAAIREQSIQSLPRHLPQGQVVDELDGNYYPVHQDLDAYASTSVPTIITPSSLLSAYQSESEWWKMINDYSQRQLSKDTDKLAALSGIAQFFQRNHFPRARYVAGLWSSRLEEELFWEVDDKINARRPVSTEYVAPSWSWASVNGRVSFQPKDPVRRFKKMMRKVLATAAATAAVAAERIIVDDAMVDVKDGNREDTNKERDKRKAICEEWKIEEVNLFPKYDDPYGALKGANLVIGGARLVKVEPFTETMREPDPDHVMEFVYRYGGLKMDGRWVADHSLDVKGEAEECSNGQLWCLGMVRERDSRRKPLISGLLLRKEKTVDVDEGLCDYSRVGTFRDMAAGLFDGVEPRRIKLI